MRKNIESLLPIINLLQNVLGKYFHESWKWYFWYMLLKKTVCLFIKIMKTNQKFFTIKYLRMYHIREMNYESDIVIRFRFFSASYQPVLLHIWWFSSFFFKMWTLNLMSYVYFSFLLSIMICNQHSKQI